MVVEMCETKNAQAAHHCFHGHLQHRGPAHQLVHRVLPVLPRAGRAARHRPQCRLLDAYDVRYTLVRQEGAAGCVSISSLALFFFTHLFGWKTIFCFVDTSHTLLEHSLELCGDS